MSEINTVFELDNATRSKIFRDKADALGAATYLLTETLSYTTVDFGCDKIDKAPNHIVRQYSNVKSFQELVGKNPTDASGGKSLFIVERELQ